MSLSWYEHCLFSIHTSHKALFLTQKGRDINITILLKYSVPQPVLGEALPIDLVQIESSIFGNHQLETI